MATLNHGILTNAGRNLFNSVIQGNSKITYTKVIFCDDKELLNMSDDEIQDLTQINVNNSLETQPVSYNEGLLQGQNGEQASEVVVRAIVSNAGSKDNSGNVIQPPLTNGFYPYVSALYASDGSNEILYGLYLKDQPGYMPAYDGFTPQPLQFTWRLYASTTDNFNLSDSKDVLATIDDLHNVNEKFSTKFRSLSLTEDSLQNQVTSLTYPTDNSSKDLNDYKKPGVYNINGIRTYTNTPDNLQNGYNWGIIHVYPSVNGDFIQELVVGGFSDVQKFIRYHWQNGKFSYWDELTNLDVNSAISHLHNQVTSLTYPTDNSSKDLNDYKKPGVYNINGIRTYTNTPDNLQNGYNWGIIHVYPSVNGDFIQELVVGGFSDVQKFIRYHWQNGKFSYWDELTNLDVNSAINNSSTIAMNQANAYTNAKFNSLQNQLKSITSPSKGSSLNLNDYKKTGTYIISGIGTYVNKPDNLQNSYNWGIIHVYPTVNEDIVQELVVGGFSDVQKFIRYGWYAKEFSNWKELTNN